MSYAIAPSADDQFALIAKIDQLNQNLAAINRAVSEDVMAQRKHNDEVGASLNPAYLSYDKNTIEQRDYHIMYDAELALLREIRKLFPKNNLEPSYAPRNEDTVVRGNEQKGKRIEEPIYLRQGDVPASVAKTMLTITYVMKEKVWTPEISLSEFSLL